MCLRHSWTAYIRNINGLGVENHGNVRLFGRNATAGGGWEVLHRFPVHVPEKRSLHFPVEVPTLSTSSKVAKGQHPIHLWGMQPP
jgi:hypothetical protein